MKRTLILFFCFSSLLFSGYAQSDASEYLKKAMENLAQGDCEKAQRNYNVYKELSSDSVEYIEKAIQECIRKSKEAEQSNVAPTPNVTNTNELAQNKKEQRQNDFMNTHYASTNKNKYVAWAIAGAGYPWNLVSSIEFRYGRNVGLGAWLDLGVDFTTINVTKYVFRYSEADGTVENRDILKAGFRYAGGIKLFFYRGFFFDLGYGSISRDKVDDEMVFNKSTSGGYYIVDGCTYTDLYSAYDKIKSNVKNSHGLLFHVGYNLVTDLSTHVGFFMGVSGGASYDVINKVLAPSINLKFGIAFKYK